MSTVAANRDPAVFPAPERFDVRRGNARHHLTLSHGHHHCLGFNLGRMQCQAAVTALFDRLPGSRDHPRARAHGLRVPPAGDARAALGDPRSPGSEPTASATFCSTSTRSASCSTGTCSAPSRSASRASRRSRRRARRRRRSARARARTAFSSSPLSTWWSRAKRSRELEVARASVSVSRETPKWQAAPSSAESAICSATACRPPRIAPIALRARVAHRRRLVGAAAEREIRHRHGGRQAAAQASRRLRARVTGSPCG